MGQNATWGSGVQLKILQVLGVQCRLGEGCAVQVVLRVVVDWEVRRCGRDQQRDDMADQMTEIFSCAQ